MFVQIRAESNCRGFVEGAWMTLNLVALSVAFLFGLLFVLLLLNLLQVRDILS